MGESLSFFKEAFQLKEVDAGMYSPLVFSYEALDQAEGTYKKLKKRIANLETEGVVDTNAVEEYKAKFVEAVGNDVNTSMAVTLLYDVLKTELNGATKRAIIESYDYVLGLDLLKAEEVQE